MPDAFVSSISLSPNTLSKTDFEIKLNMAFDEKYLKDMVALVSRHGLTLKENKGSLLIYGSNVKPNWSGCPPKHRPRSG